MIKKDTSEQGKIRTLRRREDEKRNKQSAETILRRQDQLLRERQKEKKKKDQKKEPEGFGSLLKTALSSLTVGTVIGALSESVAAAQTVQPKIETRLPSPQGKIIKGPAVGGNVMDRPIAGAMAENSVNQSLNLDYAKGTVSAGETSGNLKIDGKSISVSEYLPGSTMGKIISGQELGAGDGISMLAQKTFGAITDGTVTDEGSGDPKANPSSKVAATTMALQAAQIGAGIIGSMKIGGSKASWENEIREAEKEKSKKASSENDSSRVDRDSKRSDENKTSKTQSMSNAERLAMETHYRKVSEERDNDLGIGKS